MSQFGRSSLGPQASRLQTHGSARFRDLAGETPAVPEKSVRKLSGVVKTYINGSLKHTFSGTGAIGDANTTWNDFRIGGRQATSQHFQGRIDEVRVYNRALSASEVGLLPGGNNVPQIYWLVTDQLGTPRMVLDHTGDLNTMKRHDYLPFGEELFAPKGGRSVALGYSVADGIRQQFTLKERDIETGLDYFLARYYSSTQGRFTSIDPENYQATLDRRDAQSWNSYSYVNNNPLIRTDPDGRGFLDKLKNWFFWDVWGEDEDVQREEAKRREDLLRNADPDGGIIICSPVSGEYMRVYLREMNRINVWLWSGAMYYWEQNGGGYHQLTPEQLAGVIDVKNDAKQIADGHAWNKHQKEFPGWDKQKFTDKIDETIQQAKGSDVKKLSGERRAYWNDKEKMVVIRDPKNPDGGTAFRPTNGRAYFDNLK